MKHDVSKIHDGSYKILFRESLLAFKSSFSFRQEFYTRVVDLKTWVERVESSAQQIDSLTPTTPDAASALQRTHALLQEHAEQQHAFNTIYEEVKHMSTFSTPEETAALKQTHSELVDKYKVSARRTLLNLTVS